MKFIVEFWGDVTVEAASPEAAEKAALKLIGIEPETHLFWDTCEVRSCIFCGCTDDEACEDGCSWLPVEGDVCSTPACAAKWDAQNSAGIAAQGA